jgi:ABC-2 type transport system ATP-binding protein
MNALEINNLQKTFRIKRKKVKALNGMSFEVGEKKIVGFLGPNGAGKSTTIKSIMSLIYPDLGSINIFGKSHNNITIRKDIGFLPENPSFIDALTGKSLLNLSAKIYKLPKEVIDVKIKELLEVVELEKAANRPIRKYSKGMIQRIGFASAIIHEPKLLILDEPMSGLDPMGRYIFKNLMKNINEKGTTIFFSSHIIPDMEDVCDEVIVVKDGKYIKTLDKTQIKYFATTGYKIIFKIKNISLISNNYNIEMIDDNLFAINTNKNEIEKKLYEIKAVDAEVVDIEPLKKNLEDLFVEIVGG